MDLKGKKAKAAIVGVAFSPDQDRSRSASRYPSDKHRFQGDRRTGPATECESGGGVSAEGTGPAFGRDLIDGPMGMRRESREHVLQVHANGGTSTSLQLWTRE